MLQKFVIKIFGLDDLRQLYLSERRKQKAHDEQEYHFKYKSLEEKYERQMSLIEQEHDVETHLLKEEIREYKRREKEIDKREYLIKVNHKRNLADASLISTKLSHVGDFFKKEGSEIQRILDDSEGKKLITE